MGGNDRNDVDVFGECACGLGGDKGRACAAFAGDLDPRLRRWKIAWSRRGDEQITFAQSRSGHVAPDRGVAAHVKEAHGEAAHLQPFAPKPEHDDAPRGDNGPDPSVLSTLRHNGYKIVSRKQIVDIADQATERLGVTLDLHRNVGSLPVAGKQLVAIGRALMSSPRLLIMDEPTAALSGREIETLLQVVREIRGGGVTVVFISHKTREVLEISDRVTVLRNGAVVASGGVADFDEASITRAVTGLEHQEEPFRYAPRGGPPRLEMRGLSMPEHLHEINLSVMSGEIVGLCGLLGSARTELALTLFGMRPGYTGDILVDGPPVIIRSVQAAVRHGIGYVPEDRLSEGLFFGLTIAENILSAKIGAATKLGLDQQQMHTDASTMQAEMQIAGSSDRPVQALSGGNQQRVVLGRWLLTKPRILVLNGPTVGVDVGAKATIHKVIRGLAAQGLGVLMISDEVPELIENCNRVVTMHDGRIVEKLETAGLREQDVNDRLWAFP